jgi:hypothetical protein
MKEMSLMPIAPMQMQMQQPGEYSGRVAWQIPPPPKVRIEEILQLLLLVVLSIYMTCHMLFLPIEALSLAFGLDPDFKQMLTAMIIMYAIKYIVVFIMFYCSYHHTNLWITHHHIVLYIFSAICLLTTCFATWFIVVSDEEMRKIGFGPIIDHPFFYDFIGFAASGVIGTVYIFYLACTKPPTVYSLIPAQEPSAVFNPEALSFPGLYQPEMMQTPPTQPQYPSLPAFEYPGVFQPTPLRPEVPKAQVPIYVVQN